MKKVILKFPSPKELWAFKMITKSNSIEINLRDYTLICDCDETEIKLAIETFHATVMSEYERFQNSPDII